MKCFYITTQTNANEFLNDSTLNGDTKNNVKNCIITTREKSIAEENPKLSQAISRPSQPLYLYMTSFFGRMLKSIQMRK